MNCEIISIDTLNHIKKLENKEKKIREYIELLKNNNFIPSDPNLIKKVICDDITNILDERELSYDSN